MGHFWQILVRNIFLINMRVEINRAGRFEKLFGKFWCETCFIRYMSIMTFLDIEMAFCLWLPCSAPRLNSKILNFSNNLFGHLTSVCSTDLGSLFGITQCGNFRIFLPVRFYVKSILVILKFQKLPFLTI